MVCDKMHESTRPQEAVISCGFGPKQRLKILFKPEGTTCEQVKKEIPKLKKLAGGRQAGPDREDEGEEDERH